MMVVSILLLAVVTLSSPAWATPSSTSCPSVLEYAYWSEEDGWYYSYYNVGGNLKLTVTFNGYITASITLPKLENLTSLGEEEGLSEYFVFWPNNVDDFSYGGFGDTLLYGLSPDTFGVFGEWEQNGCNLYIDTSSLVYMLVDMMYEMGIEAEPSGSPKITAKVAKDGTHSGKINIKLNFYSPISGSLSFSMTYKSYPLLINDPKLQKNKAALRSNNQKNKTVLKSEIKNFLLSALSKLPKKGAVPQLAPSH